MSAPKFTPGPWRFRVRNAAYPNIADIETDAGYFDSELLAFTSAACDQSPANARLIAAAPDYAEACGLTLHPGENESCGPLSWLRTAIDTLKEDAVQKAASGDDPDAYWFMVNEVETLLARLATASAKARGEQVPA